MPNQPVVPEGTPESQAYSHGVISTGSRVLHISGQVGVGPEGVGADPEAQCRLAWANLLHVLSTAGMTTADLVKTTVFLTSPDHIAPFRAARMAALGGHKPASTLLIVSGLADPAWVVEVEGVAVT